MKTSRAIANVLFFISRVAAVIYLATGVYAVLVLILARSTGASWVPVSTDKAGNIEIFFPFTKTAFLLGDQSSYFLMSILLFLLYGGFFWLLGNVFNAFRHERLFTKRAVQRLTLFYIVNLIVPVSILVLLLLLQHDISDLMIITVLHAVLGIFAFFMASIFKQGLLLQEEQDLTL